MFKKPIKSVNAAPIDRLELLTHFAAKQFWNTVLQHPVFADPRRLERYGYSSYSQNDEDGIIEEIFNRIGTTNKTFFEFGAGDGIENNTHILLHSGWAGVWIDGAVENAIKITKTFSDAIAAGKLLFDNIFITSENINDICNDAKLPYDLDLISIDIDFNDYWILKALTVIKPRVVVIEYNPRFRPPLRRVVAKDSARVWDGTDYFGCSLQSLADMAAEKGYRLVGTNITGCNAFLVRSDLCGDLFSDASVAELYNPPRFELTSAGAFKSCHPGSYGVYVDG